MKNELILSRDAYPELITCLESMGFSLKFSGTLDKVTYPIRNHADLLYCRLKDGEVFTGDSEKLRDTYPGDCIYNAFSTGRYFIHDLGITDPELLKRAEELELIPVSVRQGYSNCSIVPVDEGSIITYDRGISVKARAAGIDVLEIEPGHVELEGYDTGFLGGASGKAGDTIVFNGDLSEHPDFGRICSFIEERGLRVRFFEGLPLKDIGSVI